MQQTTTDSNGYYAFNVEPGDYTLEFVAPTWAAFSARNRGDASSDSDADQMTGRLDVDVEQDTLNVDAGLIAVDAAVQNPDPALLPLAQVGPIRSGRLVHGHIANSFQNSCLIYAGASDEVLIKLPKCLMVFHQFAGGGYMLDLDQLRAVAKQNRREKRSEFDYSGNVFEDDPPAGGRPADQLDVFMSYLNQSGWTYDPLYRAYLRFVDTSEKETAGLLFADVDRLTGRQLHFENVIVLFAEHEVISPTNLDIHLEQGAQGPAVLFRDGMAYEIRWSMPAHDGGRENGRPMQWLDNDGASFPLKPGHTWVIVVTPFSTLTAQGLEWKLRFYAPEGSALGE